MSEENVEGRASDDGKRRRNRRRTRYLFQVKIEYKPFKKRHQIHIYRLNF